MKSDEQKLIDKWGDRKLIEETVKSMNLHPNSAPETRERLAILETTQKLFMEENKKEHQEIMKSLIEFHTTTNCAIKEITDKLDGALEKKADKVELQKVQEIIKWVSYLIVGGVLTALLTLVLK